MSDEVYPEDIAGSIDRLAREHRIVLDEAWLDVSDKEAAVQRAMRSIVAWEEGQSPLVLPQLTWDGVVTAGHALLVAIELLGRLEEALPILREEAATRAPRPGTPPADPSVVLSHLWAGGSMIPVWGPVPPAVGQALGSR